MEGRLDRRGWETLPHFRSEVSLAEPRAKAGLQGLTGVGVQPAGSTGLATHSSCSTGHTEASDSKLMR